MEQCHLNCRHRGCSLHHNTGVPSHMKPGLVDDTHQPHLWHTARAHSRKSKMDAGTKTQYGYISIALRALSMPIIEMPFQFQTGDPHACRIAHTEACQQQHFDVHCGLEAPTCPLVPLAAAQWLPSSDLIAEQPGNATSHPWSTQSSHTAKACSHNVCCNAVKTQTEEYMVPEYTCLGIQIGAICISQQFTLPSGCCICCSCCHCCCCCC
jgi:hypothetical protein